MINTKYVFILVMILLVGSMKDKLFKYDLKTTDEKHYEIVKNYLLNDSSLARSKLPIIWVHVKNDINSRSWKNFNSRNTDTPNQPYTNITIKSIVDKCGKQFNVCLIDDESFAKIIPGWVTDMSKIASPVKDKMRELAIAQILHLYGGILLPSTFVCFKNINKVYSCGCKKDKMFVGELVNRKISCNDFKVYPTTKIMGCKKNCEKMREYINYLENNISTDYTSESHFNGDNENWIKDEVEKDNIKLIKAEQLGALDSKNEIVTIDRLLKNTYINLNENAIGLYVDDEEILKRTNYQWFARMNAEQVMSSNTFLGKVLLTNSKY